MNRPAWVRHMRGFIIASLVGFFLAVSNAFDLGEAPLVVRLIYWQVMMALGTLCGVAVSFIVERGPLQERPILQGIAVTVMMTPLLTLLVWQVTGRAFGDREAELGSLPYFFGPVLLVTMATTALNYLVQREPVVTHAAPTGAAAPRFLDRLPPKLRGAELYAVEAEDHYLRLHTSRGQDLILMRLSDAVAELEGIEGAQTHRSWWVAKEAVSTAKRGDGRAVLTLKTGQEAPVSRAYAKALREAGWF